MLPVHMPFENIHMPTQTNSHQVRIHFRRVRKIVKSDYYLRRVCPSVRMEELGSHWMGFEDLIFEFSKHCRRSQVS
jgi:hypothetical protein